MTLIEVVLIRSREIERKTKFNFKVYCVSLIFRPLLLQKKNKNLDLFRRCIAYPTQNWLRLVTLTERGIHISGREYLE
jgi:hypothetical protein